LQLSDQLLVGFLVRTVVPDPNDLKNSFIHLLWA